MAEVLVQFDSEIVDTDRHAYVARVCGRQAEDGMWDGWIEFEPADGGPVLRTPRETKQPKRTDLDYWAGGLSAAYLEGALERAIHPDLPDLRPREIAVEPAYDGPADPPAPGQANTKSRVHPHAVLDPFEVYEQGEDVLMQELLALDEGHLRNIALAHDLLAEDEVSRAIGRNTLAQLIVVAVRNRAK
jgi:hypothetical protein